jgi:ABC-2 type transport system permease protein
VTTLWLLRAFVLRDWRVATSYRLPFLFQLVSGVFELAVFFFMGRFVDRAGLSGAAVIGGDYFSFVIFGTVLVSIVHTSVGSFAQRLHIEQTTGTLEALFASPSPPELIILASAMYDLLETTVFALLTVLVGIVFFGLDLDVSATSLLVGAVGLLATVVLFAAVGVAIAGFVLVFKRGGALIGFVSAGLALLGGVYYDNSVLPVVLRVLARLSPFTWSLELLRSAFLRAGTEWALLGMLVAAAAIALPLSLRVFSSALRRAERAGSLALY